MKFDLKKLGAGLAIAVGATVAASAPAFAAAVIELIGDPAAAAALGRQARARTIERYGWDARLAALDPLMGFADRPTTRSAA